MNNNTTYQLIKNLAAREKIAEKEVIEILCLAIQDVYQQKNPTSGKLQVIFNPEKKQFMAHRIYQIVEEVNDPTKEITTEDKLFQSKKNFLQEKNLLQPLNLKKITDYKEILQHFCLSLQKSQQKKWSEELLPLQGKIIEGTIQETYPNYCLVSLLGGKGLGYWGRNEWLSRDVPFVGKTQRFLVKETQAEGKYPVILARRDENFLRKLLEIEIPEIAQGKIVIQDILRWPGVISKVIVKSKVPMKNPLGACIGERGVRVQNIEEEMNPERIDLVEWKEDKKEQLIKLFSPVKILGFCKIQKKEDLAVVVHPEQLSLSLALKGKVVRLIEDYLKIKIKVLTWEEINKENAIIIETINDLKKDWSNTSYPQLNYKPYGSE